MQKSKVKIRTKNQVSRTKNQESRTKNQEPRGCYSRLAASKCSNIACGEIMGLEIAFATSKVSRHCEVAEPSGASEAISTITDNIGYDLGNFVAANLPLIETKAAMVGRT